MPAVGEEGGRERRARGLYLTRYLVLFLSPLLHSRGRASLTPPVPAPASAQEPQDQDAAGWLTIKPKGLSTSLALTTDHFPPPHFSRQASPFLPSLPPFQSHGCQAHGLGACSEMHVPEEKSC